MSTLPKKPFSNPQLKDDLSKTASASAVIQTYVGMILQQADIKLDALPDLPAHQKTARDHANSWNNTVLPEMIKTNADIIDYANEFASFYETLVKYAKDVANPESRKKLVEGLKLLHDTIQKKYESAKGVTDKLSQFHSELTVDNQNFLSDCNTAEVKIAGDDGEIKALSKQLDAIQDGMNKDIGLMAGGAVAIVVGIGMVFVGVVAEIPSAGLSTALIGGGVLVVSGGAIMETFGATDYSKLIEQQKEVNEKLAKDKQQLTSLKAIKGQLSGFLLALESAITAAEALMVAWQTLGADLNEVISAIDRVDPSISSDFIVDELGTAKSDWEVALDQAKKLQANGKLPIKVYDNLQDAFKKMQPQG
jgi:DNA repair exonuclease SbcCD ATPase subunit